MLKQGILAMMWLGSVVAAELEPAHTPEPEESGTIHVQITGAASDQGSVAVVLFDSRSAYDEMKEPVTATYLDIRDGSSEWVVEDLPYGTYAVMTYHDENGNEKLDSNLLRIPKERYGFSNNARGRFGPPAFDAAHVSLNQEVLHLQIELR